MSALQIMDAADPRWRSHALEHADSPLQHPAWLDTLIGAYGLRARVAALTAGDGTVLASLPLIASKLPWRRRWTALPFTDALAPVAADAAQRERLLGALAERPHLKPALVRTRAQAPGWTSRRVGSVHTLDISAGLDEVLRAANRQTRQNVRVAERSERGLTVRALTSRSEFMGPHLALVARSRSRVGVPTQPRRYWSRLWEMHERGDALTLVVDVDGRIAASGLFLLGASEAVYKYSHADLVTRNLRTNYLLLAAAIERLNELGLRSLDFGITDLRNESLCRFKRQWGSEERPAYFSATDSALLPRTIEPGRLLSKTIQRSPSALGRTIGSLAYGFIA